MPKTTSCTPLHSYLPAELHHANYSLGMLINCHRLGAKNSEALAMMFGVLSVGGAQRLHPEEALRTTYAIFALCHAEQ
jgi:hypothetical protein